MQTPKKQAGRVLGTGVYVRLELGQLRRVVAHVARLQKKATGKVTQSDAIRDLLLVGLGRSEAPEEIRRLRDALLGILGVLDTGTNRQRVLVEIESIAKGALS